MASQPLISVITVCRNCAKQLETTAKSVEAQTFGNFEWIIVDGASTDNDMLPLLKNYAENGAVTVSEPDNGIFDAMNKGAKLASGAWVVYMNAGDYFPADDTLLKVAETLKNTDADVVYGDQFLKSDNGTLIFRQAQEPANRHRMYFCHQSAYIKRSLMLEIPYRMDVGLAGDFCFFKNAWHSGAKFKHINEPLTIYDLSGVSTQNRMKVIRQYINVINRFDPISSRVKFIPRLRFVLLWNSLRNLFHKKR